MHHTIIIHRIAYRSYGGVFLSHVTLCVGVLKVAGRFGFHSVCLERGVSSRLPWSESLSTLLVTLTLPLTIALTTGSPSFEHVVSALDVGFELLRLLCLERAALMTEMPKAVTKIALCAILSTASLRALLMLDGGHLRVLQLRQQD